MKYYLMHSLEVSIHFKVLTEMSQISDARVIDQKISELQEELNTVWDTLMGYELQLAEQLEVMNSLSITYQEELKFW